MIKISHPYLFPIFSTCINVAIEGPELSIYMYVNAAYTPTEIKNLLKNIDKVRETCSDHIRTSADSARLLQR